MGWFCKCPRCLLADWDFQAQGNPQGDEWQNTGTHWKWTPNVQNRIGGYRVIATGLSDMSVQLRFNNGVEASIAITYQSDADGVMYYMTIGDPAYIIASTEQVSTIADAVRFDLCYWRPLRQYWLKATLYDENRTYLGEMHAQIPGANTQSPIAFAPPTITIPLGVDYVAIDGLQDTVDECCDLCRPTDCRRLKSLPQIQSGGRALIYGNMASIRFEAEIAADTPPWLIIEIGECCDDNGTLVGSIMRIDASLSAEEMVISWSDCGSYHGNGSISAPLSGDWQTGNHTYTFTLCIRDYISKLTITLAATDETGRWGFASVDLFTWLNSFERRCYPEFAGATDPATVFNLDGGYVVQAVASHPIRPSPGHIDPCWCVPIPSALASSLCDAPLCDDGPLPQGWIAEISGLPTDWQRFQGAYVLRPDAICPSPVTTECTSAGGNEEYWTPGHQDYVFASNLENYMQTNYPGVTEYPTACELTAGNYNYAPNGTMFTLCIEVYRPADVTQYERYEVIPVLVHVRISRYDPLEGLCEGCAAGTIAMMMGALPLPACPDWPSVTPTKITEYAWHTDDERCTTTTPSLNPSVTISPVL